MKENKLQTSLSERVKTFLHVENVNMSEFSRMTNTSNSFVISIKKNIGIDKIKILKTINKNLSLEWLLFGTGEMFNTESELEKNLNSKLEAAQKENLELKKELEILKRENALLQRITELQDRTKNGIENVIKNQINFIKTVDLHNDILYNEIASRCGRI